MGISLEKKVAIIEAVARARNIPDTKLAVKAAIDISGSMSDEFGDGTVQEAVDRFLAVGVKFDDNQSIEMYAFGSGSVRLDDVTPAQFGNYVKSTFLPQAKASGYLWSGTDYSKCLALVAKDTKPAMFGFGKKQAPSYLMFMTDGQTNDKAAAEKQIEKLGQQNVYVQLIGLGRDDFSWLQLMGDRYDHVGFVTIPNLSSMTDEQLYDKLLTDELADWIRTR